jgi:hypothetical protein
VYVNAGGHAGVGGQPPSGPEHEIVRPAGHPRSVTVEAHTRGAGLEGEAVVEIDGLEDRAKLVITVVPAKEHFEA